VSEEELRKALEAILLVVEEPVDTNTLAQVLETATDEVHQTLTALRAEYVDQGRGFVLREAGGGWRLYTDPGAAAYVERFATHGRSGRLSQASLETLAVVAYKQPVTRSQISEIRGVDADGAVRSLVSRGLVEEVGRDPAPGQPLLYATTRTFLERLGLRDLADLPPLPELTPAGPLPAEPAPGQYRAARRELDLLAHEVPAAGVLDEADGGRDPSPDDHDPSPDGDTAP
jgi:segregation and condensation protein B